MKNTDNGDTRDTTILKGPEGRTNLAETAKKHLRPKQRDHYIDLVRGICAVGIVFTHTCFFSGRSYVPMPIRSISQLLEVPALFFVAGMTTAYIRKDTILNQLFKLSMIFVLLGLICNLVNGGVTWASIFRPMFLMGVKVSPLFRGVSGSYWFVPIYACTIILGGIVIRKNGGGGVSAMGHLTHHTHLRSSILRGIELCGVQLPWE